MESQALLLATRQGNVDLIQSLLQDSGTHINIQNWVRNLDSRRTMNSNLHVLVWSDCIASGM